MYDNGIYSTTILDLPAQMIPLSKKNDNWKETCMDGLEQIARAQYTSNISLIENYEMVKGRFIYNHYFETEGYSDLVSQLTREFELPSYLRHYDIISQVINTLSGEYQKRPDIFRVKNYSEKASNDFLRAKTDLLFKYVKAKIDGEITQKLLEQGIDPNKQDFQSDEEEQQYQQKVDQAKQILTPSEIEKYMLTSWQEAAEIWGSNQLELDKQKYNLAEKEKKEFEDMLVADRCFRHFYITANGYNQETWNPVQTFFHKSPDVEYIEDGDYVGRIFYLSLPAIIDKYGFMMKKEEIEALQDHTLKSDDGKWNYAKGTEYVFNEYMMPFKGFQGYDIARKTTQFGQQADTGIPHMDSNFFDSVLSGKFFTEKRGLYVVTEGYWKSQRKIGKVTYINPETGILTKQLVDEFFIVPKEFKEIDPNDEDSDDVNTIVWTWVNQVWGGIKVNLKNTNYGKNLYLNIKPIEFQFKGDLNPYSAKLPVCGQVFSIRNSKSMSLVDLMKPYQIFYNVAMNQLYQIAEREIGKFIVMDVNMFPNLKDWGGEKGWEKFMMVAKQLGMAPADTSPSNTKGALAATAGAFPKEFNFDDSARMLSRMSLAKEFEQMALRQVGFNQYRLGAYTSEATASGIEAGKSSSYAQTESYFTNFSNYIRRCHEMDLSIAQYVQAKEKDITIMYAKSDMSRAWVKIQGIDLLLSDLHVRVINSQEYIRQLESLRQLGLQNNTTGATLEDLAELITSNSVSEIKVQLKESTKRIKDMQDQQYQLQQQQIEQERDLKLQELDREDANLDKTLQNKLDVAQVVAQGKAINDSVPEDNTKSQELYMKNQMNQSTVTRDQLKLELQRQRQIADDEYNMKKLALEQAKINSSLQIEDKKLELTKIMKGKENKK